jgi:hypothetical protein
MTSCEQKRSGCVASSYFSFFLSGLLFAFMMTLTRFRRVKEEKSGILYKRRDHD